MPTSLLRFDGAVADAPAVQAWLARTEPRELYALARTWFAVMRQCGDEVREVLHDGCPVACFGDVPFAYVNVYRAHVNVGFFQGAGLPDPAGLLRGTGRYMRHVTLRPDSVTDAAALTRLIDDAFDDIKRRVERGD